MEKIDFENVGIDDLRSLARSLWWILDSMKCADLIHGSNDVAFRNSARSLLSVREECGVSSNDGKTLDYDPERHDESVTSAGFFMTRPDGDMYPDDDVKRSEMLKMALDSRGIVGHCKCDSCAACSSAMWRVDDALHASIEGLAKMDTHHAKTLRHVMYVVKSVLRSLADQDITEMSRGGSMLAAAAQFVSNMITTRTGESMAMALSGLSLSMGMRPRPLTREQAASLPESLKKEIRESIEKAGGVVPPELLPNGSDKEHLN